MSDDVNRSDYDTTTTRQTTEQQRSGTAEQRGGDAVQRIGGALTGVIEATGDIACTTIDEIGNVAAELVSTTGRVAQTTINEALTVVGSIVGSVMGGAAAFGSRRDRRRPRYGQQDRYAQSHEDRYGRDQSQETTTTSSAI